MKAGSGLCFATALGGEQIVGAYPSRKRRGSLP